MSNVKSLIDDLAETVGKLRTFDVVAFLTAYTLFRISHLPIDMALAIGAAILVCVTPVRRSPWLWLGIAAVWLPRMFVNFHLYEDHCFFVIYWCAALGLAQWGCQQAFLMRRSARLLIGLCFALGFLWKIVAVEFYDGSLFHFKLLYDYRFMEMVSGPFGGVTHEMGTANLNAYHSIRTEIPVGGSVPLTIPKSISWFAGIMTCWTIFIEGLIAVLFLLPRSRIAEKWRDATLLFFMVSTYFVVPVMGFASAFTTLGFAQARSNRMKLAYLMTTLGLFVWFSVRWKVLGLFG